MIEHIFLVYVDFFDINEKISTKTFRIFDTQTAVRWGRSFGYCENVKKVEILDLCSGENIFIMENGEIVKSSEEAANALKDENNA